MTNPKTIASLFQEKPQQWGMRGDPHLWAEMRSYFERTPLPSTAAELSAMIETAFEALTGHPLSTSDHFYIERFSHGGMSSGYIAPDFWRNKFIPLLCARYNEIV